MMKLNFTILCVLLTGTAWAQHTDSIPASGLPHDSLVSHTVVLSDSLTALDSLKRKDSLLTQSFTPPARAGNFIITGQVKDASTGELLPFVNVFFPKSSVGMPTDMNGRFRLSFQNFPGDTLNVSYLGYKTLRLAVNKTLQEQNLRLELERGPASLKEFTISAGEDPALLLLKRIIKRKPANNIDRFSNYHYELYNKLELDIDKIRKDQFDGNFVTKPFSFIFDNIDSTSEDKPFLPVFLSETLSDYYYRKEPKKSREIIKATRTSGIKNKSLNKYLGGFYQNINVYDNFIPVFDKKFISPVSDAGAFYYRYKLVDTQYIYNRKCIQVQFMPKRKGENTFEGEFWVHDTTFAIQKMSMEVSGDANLNWIKKVSLVQEYIPVTDSSWFLVKDKFIADFIPPHGNKFAGFIGRKTTTYRDIIVNNTEVDSLLEDKRLKQDVTLLTGADEKNENYWNEQRHDSLSKNEKSIYAMVDTLQSMPLFKTYSNTITLLATGTRQFGAIELGPYWNIYSHNPHEGSRLRFTMGTTPKLFKDIYLQGYLAYGFYDHAFKGKISGLWLLNRSPRSYIFASYTHDLDNSTSYYDEVSQDNFLSIAIRKKGVPWKFVFTDEKRVEYYKEFYSGFGFQVYSLHKNVMPYAPLPTNDIFLDENGNDVHWLTNTEVGLRLRFAYKEKFLEGNYYRVSLGSGYPILDLKLGAGIKGLFNSRYSYQKVSLSISDNMSIPPLGKIYYNFFGGQYFGTLPYLLLEIVPGNEFYYYNKYAFNMMNKYEFIADRYAGFNFEHTIGGGVFNYIPYVRKLRLRQFWNAKGIIGDLTKENLELNFNKGYPFQNLAGNPYLEVGTGVENILNVFRVDFVWRVLPQTQPGEPQNGHFGIFGSMKFQF